MNFCTNCGAQLNPQGNCPECGRVNQVSHQATTNDTGSFGWALLGFCIPIIGLILYLVWKDTQPLNANAAGKGALVSVGLSVFFYIILIVAASSL